MASETAASGATSAQDGPALFTQALNVINAALDANRERTPYKQLIDASERLIGGRRLGVAVYAEGAAEPHDYFTIRYSNGAFELLEHGKSGPEIDWKVSREYLQRVAENPKEYTENPALLDWDWLKSRLGLL